MWWLSVLGLVGAGVIVGLVARFAFHRATVIHPGTLKPYLEDPGCMIIACGVHTVREVERLNPDYDTSGATA